MISKLHRNNKTQRIAPKYPQATVLQNYAGLQSTPWHRVLTFGTSGDFIVSINFTRIIITTKLLPIIKFRRTSVSNSSPYRNTKYAQGRKHSLSDIDLIGIVLWYLKSQDAMYKLYPIFGLVPSSISVWLEYGMEVMSEVVKDKTQDYLRINGLQKMKCNALYLFYRTIVQMGTY